MLTRLVHRVVLRHRQRERVRAVPALTPGVWTNRAWHTTCECGRMWRL